MSRFKQAHFKYNNIKSQRDWWLKRRNFELNTQVQREFFRNELARFREITNETDDIDALERYQYLQNTYFAFQARTGCFETMPPLEFLLRERKNAIFTYRQEWENNTTRFRDRIIEQMIPEYHVETFYRKRLYNFEDIAVIGVLKNEEKKTKTKSANKKRLRNHIKKMYGERPKCVFCEKSMTMGEMTLEHVIPNSLGGTWTIPNIAPSCDSCNNERATQEFYEFLAYKRGWSDVKKVAF